MVQKLLKPLLFLSLGAPLSAFALGLGEARLHSALSERLEAEIELLSVSPAEAESISVSLASQETFDKIGLERPAVLMFLRFDVEQDSGGNYIIKLGSKEPINEPFLDFLVEVEWKSGRVLREYTLLLDPPTTHREAAPAVSRPSTAPAAPAAPAKRAAAPVDKAAVISQLKAVSGEPSAAAPMAAPSVPAGGLVYGPVTANDTLWAIARKVRPSSDISVQQMMVALLKANPYAFFDGNINRLKRGFVLRIDDPSMLTTMNKAEAAREVARQTRAWEDYREQVAARAKQRPAASTAMEAAPGAAAVSKAEPKLKLVAPEGKGVDAAAPSGAAEGKGAEGVSEDLMLALESSAAQRKENAALKQRLEALEGQLQDMEQIIKLKDADLAALQQQLREQGKAVELPSEQQAAVELVKPAEPAAEKPAEAAPAAEVKEEPAKPAAEEAAAKAEPKPKAKPKPKKKPVVVTTPPEPTLVDMLMDNLMYIVGGVVALLLLVILAVFIKRRRKGGFQESILTGGSTSMMKGSDEEASETSFLSDLAISGMGPGPIQSDEGEVDPLTEADVFMAYGRNQQAEEVLKKAREKSPERMDIAAKLLEVYYNSKDREKFEGLAEEAVASLQEDEELWGKVLAMGYELCPDNILFEAGAGAEPPAPAAAEPQAEPAGEAVMDIGLDLDELAAEMEGEGAGEVDLDLGLDFSDLEEPEAGEAELGELDLDLGQAEEGAEAEPSEAAAEEEGLGFDLDLGAEEEAAAPAESEMEMALEMGGEEEGAAEGELDFDLDLGELAAEEEAPAAEAAEELGGLDLELGELAAEEEVPATEAAEEELGLEFELGELAAEEEEAPAAEAAEEELGLEFDLGELGGAEEALATAGEEGAELDMSLDELGGLDELGDLSDLGDLDTGEDEMTTKLDLAQAYAEMGDAEGARSMLEEVVASGDDEQKQQAQALLDKL